MNKYLDKASSFLVGAAASHLAQNLASKAAIRSSLVGKSLGTAFANGVKGVSDKGIKHSLKHGVMGAISPDVAVMHKTVHTLGSKISPVLKDMTLKEKLALRHVANGDFVKLHSRGLHKSPALQKVIDVANTHTHIGIGRLDSLSASKAKQLQDVWKSKDHPILSNISKHLSRAKPSATATPGKASIRSSGVGAVLSAAVDAPSAVLSSAKTFSASHFSNSNKYIKKSKDLMEKTFVKDPIKKGYASKGKDFLHGVKNRASELLINPVSSSLKHTSSAISKTFHE